MTDAGRRAFAPGRHPIESYGNGGFRFGGLSHRGSILCLPDAVRGWAVADAVQIDEGALAEAFAQADALDFFLLGTGKQAWSAPTELRLRFRALGVTLEVMQTGAAIRIYNVVLGEGRRVGAGLIAVP